MVGERPVGRARAVIGVVRESAQGERRVAMVPKVLERLSAKGIEVVVQPDAGAAALIPDAQFERAGAKLADPWAADIVVKVAPPTEAEIARLRSGSVLIGFLEPQVRPEITSALRAAGVHGFAMEAIPRISRAQAMDALSSQGSIAGYRAALLAAEHLTRFLPMLTTAAGTVPPASVLVLGAGVAGLQALATARRLGARTTGYDVRPEVADQVRSVGAQWLELDIAAVGSGGYARELTEAERVDQQHRLTDAVMGFDAVISTAQVPGQPAPVLVTAEAVAGMRAGSVVVDLAGAGGGNCALSEPGETVVRDNVTVSAPLNLASSMPEHASELYARNVLALLDELLDEQGALAVDFTDEVVAATCVTGQDGQS
ncbi:NAD(P) transhydrogenase subunit alpha [Tamaricihabitans halophyticus]|uniref:proton-translocating NAD(P)(+) transhydrogenase n=1 Tax=Tamaricihabitans halophyticus TaxID=1262583 RepID=A0A4R2QXU7_9PSEU|nr:NAD(P) transhydrogenase subunit alpha [Tamaricihabitans halophyticus]TCP54983.1 NAD(P) transhydrogenase subunit alpha [Tamaricihabitans halophyticus]